MTKLEIVLKSGRKIIKPFSQIKEVNYNDGNIMHRFIETHNYLDESIKGPLTIKTRLFSIYGIDIMFKKYIIPKENIDMINYKKLFYKEGEK